MIKVTLEECRCLAQVSNDPLLLRDAGTTSAMLVHFFVCQRTLDPRKISVIPTGIVLTKPVWPEPCDIYFLNPTYNFTTYIVIGHSFGLCQLALSQIISFMK